MMIRVELAFYEMRTGELVGTMRREASEKSRRTAPHSPEKLLHNDVQGARAEIAVAKLLNRYWPGSVDAPKEDPDVGEMIQVRWAEEHERSLIVRPEDPDDQFFFLVTGLPPALSVRGFILGGEAKKPAWERAPNGRPPAWFVPPSALRDPIPGRSTRIGRSPVHQDPPRVS